MKASTIYGLALIVGTVAGVATMSLHPTGAGGFATPEALATEIHHLVAVHVLALFSVPVLVFGFVGLTRRLGWDRPEAVLALTFYVFAAIAVMFAAIADGLINAALIPKTVDASEAALPALKAMLAYNFQLNQACAKVYVVGSSVAIFAWSVAVTRLGAFERVVGRLGWVIGAPALAGLLSGHVRMSAHGFGLIIFAQSLWVVAIGASMLRAGRVDPAAPVAVAV